MAENSPEYMRRLMEKVNLHEFGGVARAAGDRKWFIEIVYKSGDRDYQGPYDSRDEAREHKARVAMEHDQDGTSHQLKVINIVQKPANFLD